MEEWRSIEGYPQYEVSSLGRVKSFMHDKVNGRIRKLSLSCKDYIRIPIDKNHFFVHRLVAQAFIPNPNDLPTVDHINRIKTDNRVENLRWASHTLQIENSDIATGERNGMARLTKEEALEIKALHKQGLGKRKIAKLLGCTISKANCAIVGWKHLD
jgi:hypothetical protein